jgi:prevent-host-death family protein
MNPNRKMVRLAERTQASGANAPSPDQILTQRPKAAKLNRGAMAVPAGGVVVTAVLCRFLDFESCYRTRMRDFSKIDMTNYTTNIPTMKRRNVAEAKTHFSSIVEEVEEGETIVICRRNIPVAKISPHSSKGPGKRHRTKIGWAKGSGVIIHGDLTESAIPQSEWDMLR